MGKGGQLTWTGGGGSADAGGAGSVDTGAASGGWTGAGGESPGGVTWAPTMSEKVSSPVASSFLITPNDGYEGSAPPPFRWPARP